MPNSLKSLVIFGLLGIFSCEDHENPLAYQKNAHGRGKVVILVEESFKPLFETSIDTFESLFPKANVVAKYKPEGEMIEKFYSGDYKTICISRQLNSKELSDLKKKQIEVRSDKVAVEGIALITNPANKDSLITIDQLKRILNGKETLWPQLKRSEDHTSELQSHHDLVCQLPLEKKKIRRSHG